MNPHYAKQAIQKAQRCAEVKWNELQTPEAWFFEELRIIILVLIVVIAIGLPIACYIDYKIERRKDA